jgi:hypothetical protein
MELFQKKQEEQNRLNEQLEKCVVLSSLLKFDLYCDFSKHSNIVFHTYSFLFPRLPEIVKEIEMEEQLRSQAREISRKARELREKTRPNRLGKHR